MSDDRRRLRGRYVAGSALPKTEPRRKAQPRRKPVKRQRVLTKESVNVNSKFYVAIIGIACIAVLICGLFYIGASSESATLNKDISTVNSQISAYQQNNDSIRDELADLTDLETIRKKAMKLGMVPVDESKIITYNKTESEYVRQNENIPK